MALDVYFRDYVKLTAPTQEEITEFKDNLGSMGKKSLWVKMAASHSAIINKNRRFYIPSRMADGISTLRFDKKPTKILKHHDSTADPVGVIRGGVFVPTIPEDLVNNPDVATLMSSTASMKDQLASMRNLMRAGVLDREDWQGLGYMELVAEILDSKTIEQIQDQRFDAVSASIRSPGEAYCSVCAQNIAKDGWCDHDEGELYSDEVEDEYKFPAMIIPGKHINQETSLVVFDADPLTTVEIIDEDDKTNNKTFYSSDFSKEEIMSSGAVFEFKDSVTNREEKTMFDLSTLSDTERKTFDILKKLRPDVEDKVLGPYAQSISAMADENGVYPDQEEAALDENTTIQYLLEDLETKDQDIDGDQICEDMKAELSKMKEEGLLTDEEFEAADAKLSTEERKKLGSSTFCGPDRSFPVPDCAHVTAAKRLIGRYKGPGSKTKILACVNRKAKALGCDKSKDSENHADEGNVKVLPCQEDSLKAMKDDELRNLFHVAELELINRDLKLQRECSDCAKHIAETAQAKKELGEARDAVEDSKNTLTVLRNELKMSYDDYASQVDETVRLGTEINTLKAEKLAVVGVLTQKYDNLEKAMDDLKKTTDINAMEISIMDSFDINAAAIKLNDGMARTPEGEVENPGQASDVDNIPLTDEDLSAPALSAIENIKEYLEDGDSRSAKRLYDRMIAMKLFSDKITFESLSAGDNGAAE
jgi:hypothetical protein